MSGLGPHALLRQRYEAQRGAWAYLEEVGNGTGGTKTRAADALALSLWPGRGIELHGHEIKVSRADWLRELRDVAKADSIQRFCDRWWLVVGDPAIVTPDELPPRWGLMAVKGGRLVATKPAPKLKRAPWTPAFVAAVFRAHTKHVETNYASRDSYRVLEAQLRDDDLRIEERVRERVALASARAIENAARNAPSAAALAAFEAATGHKLHDWNWERVAGWVQLAERLQEIACGPGAVFSMMRNRVEDRVSRLQVFLEQLAAVEALPPLADMLPSAPTSQPEVPTP